MKEKNWKLFITCEHGGNTIPDPYKRLFKASESELASHRGYDIGALTVANKLGHELADFYHYATVSRLLIELNRSLGHPRLWSEFTTHLSKKEKNHILEQYYFSYRQLVESAINETIAKKNSVIHISVHSFSPELNGEKRNAEIGLLYDPTNKLDKQFCKRWQSILDEMMPHWRIRCNYPYRGNSDGLTTYLRKRYMNPDYIGIELEMNQQLFFQSSEQSCARIADVIKKSLQAVFLNGL